MSGCHPDEMDRDSPRGETRTCGPRRPVLALISLMLLPVASLVARTYQLFPFCCFPLLMLGAALLHRGRSEAERRAAAARRRASRPSLPGRARLAADPVAHAAPSASARAASGPPPPLSRRLLFWHRAPAFPCLISTWQQARLDDAPACDPAAIEAGVAFSWPLGRRTRTIDRGSRRGRSRSARAVSDRSVASLGVWLARRERAQFQRARR